jgi:hypothetical protein
LSAANILLLVAMVWSLNQVNGDDEVASLP